MVELRAIHRHLLIAVILGVAVQVAGILLVLGLNRIHYGPGHPYFGGCFTNESVMLYTTLGPVTENGVGALIYYVLAWKDWRPRPFWHRAIFITASLVLAYSGHRQYDNIQIWGVMPLFLAMPLQFLRDRPAVGGVLAYSNTVVTHIVNNTLAIWLALNLG